ncbi:hypothetical protein SASPL_135887 [Salvia splendens]|uniref:Uncharacterized protein n=1 Tax=Salvia splendens TaxID=180675 RepID=A0A8X8X0D2_SALSN|nr:hypothetical protein SASPL_135887 [Salvia splendens]
MATLAPPASPLDPIPTLSFPNSTTASSLLSISQNLTTLHHLYNCLDDLLLLHHTHQLFSRDSHHKWVHACATKDILSHAKDHLHSFLRLRRDSDNLITSRKTAKKMIHKTLRHITSLKHKPSILALADKDAKAISVISMLKETEAATVDLIESLLCSVSGRQELIEWMFSELDAALEKLVRLDGLVQVEELGMQLREMEESLDVVEEKVEGLFKRLVRTRVSLLNMHSN